MKQGIHDLRVLKASGTEIIDSGLRTVPLEVLTLISSAMSNTTGRRQSSEEKLQSVLPLIFPNLRMMETAQQSIIAEQVTMMDSLLQIFVEEFHVHQSGQTVIDIQSFTRMVEKEVGRRDDGRVEPEQRRCAIM